MRARPAITIIVEAVRAPSAYAAGRSTRALDGYCVDLTL